MESSDLDTRALRSGFLIGLLAIGVVAFVISLALGVDAVIAIVVAIALGIVVGGPLGALASMRASQLKSR